MDAQADQSSLYACTFCWFCHVIAQINYAPGKVDTNSQNQIFAVYSMVDNEVGFDQTERMLRLIRFIPGFSCYFCHVPELFKVIKKEMTT